MSEDDSNDSGFAAAAIGGGIGLAVGGPVGAAAGAGISWWLNQRESEDELSDHNRALLRAAREVNHIADERGGLSASLYLAHLEGKTHDLDTEDGGTRNVLTSVEGDPDLIYSDVGGPTGNLIVEVETVTSLQTQAEHTVDQLARYRLRGYRTVLAVPNGEKAAAEEFVDEHKIEDPIYVVEAVNIATLL
jgi:hypothetical protein